MAKTALSFGRLYGDLEIKVADPVVEFCETVVDP